MHTMALAGTQMPTHEWILKRNCSLTPRQLALAFAVQSVLSFSVALIFTLQGAWLVLAYAFLEMGGLAAAFLHYARHATDHEHIALSENCLLVEQVDGSKVRQIRLDPSWTRIALPQGSRKLVGIEARGVRIEVGRFLPEPRRRQFAMELKQELHSALA